MPLWIWILLALAIVVVVVLVLAFILAVWIIVDIFKEIAGGFGG